MADSRSNPKVDFFFNKAGQWQEEFAELRTIILDCQLTEELKWECPAAGPRADSDSADGEGAGGTPGPLHRGAGDKGTEACTVRLYP